MSDISGYKAWKQSLKEKYGKRVELIKELQALKLEIADIEDTMLINGQTLPTLIGEEEIEK